MLAAVLFPSGMIISLIHLLFSTRFSESKKRINNYFYSIAFCIDLLGNVTLQGPLNLCLIRENGYQFGRVDETISSVLGKNERDGTLTKYGKTIVKILDFIEKNHCKKAIKEF